MNRTSEVLSNYANEPVGVRANLATFLETGRLAGSGKLVILPVDQGMEHGPATSFQPNPLGYDPNYHPQLAIEAKLSGYAAPFGFLSTQNDAIVGRIPTILKLNNSTNLTSSKIEKDQAFTSSVKDALELGCRGVGLTIYPGSNKFVEMLEEARDIISEARSFGLPSFVWSYSRGGDLTSDGETALDVIAYAAHIAAQIGAHVIKIKPPTAHIALERNQKLYEDLGPVESLTFRVKHVLQAAFAGNRIVIFSGGPSKQNEGDVLKEIANIVAGGAYGSIVGRNVFQRDRESALSLLNNIVNLYVNN